MFFESENFRPYKEEFKYKHNNPYSEKLKNFNEFVFSDHDAENLKGLWNKSVFKNQLPLNLEIGSGFGHFMINYSTDHPNINFIGLDFRFKRSFQLSKKLEKLHKQNINIKYLRAKAERLDYLFDESEVDNLFYFFPDPWPKKRHLKKRLFKQKFLEDAYKVLKPGSKFYIKTDHLGYYLWMKEVINNQSKRLFEIKLETFDLHKDYPDHFLSKYVTKFEKIFLKKNIRIQAIVLESTKK